MPSDRFNHALRCVALAALVGCGSEPAAPASAVSPVARQYLVEVVALLEQHSLRRSLVSWTLLRDSVLADAELGHPAGNPAQTIEDTWPSIEKALVILNDNHSFYRATTGEIVKKPFTCMGTSAPTPMLPSTIGYVRVGGFSGIGAPALAFANGIQAAIKAEDRDGLIGWIVDLRDNTGGNMWPMIAGLESLLGDGVLGNFVTLDGLPTPWSIAAGRAFHASTELARVDAPYTLRSPFPWVAVLISGRTASSGEATAISFMKRGRSRFFGSQSCGLATSNQGFVLSDGALLAISNEFLADRDRMRQLGAIRPDELETDHTAAVNRAVLWIQAQTIK